MIALVAAIVSLVKEIAKLREAIEDNTEALNDLNLGDQRAVRWKIGKPRPE